MMVVTQMMVVKCYKRLSLSLLDTNWFSDEMVKTWSRSNLELKHIFRVIVWTSLWCSHNKPATKKSITEPNRDKAQKTR